MRVSDKLALIDKIGRELQSRFGYAEIDAFLAEFNIKPPGNVGVKSKWVYSKVALTGTSDQLILKIAEELELITPGVSTGTLRAPRNWTDTKFVRLFISHISKDKIKATRLKECLAPFGILGFVAHEDIHPTLEWQAEIERALQTMDAFIAVHTPGFSKSVWTQQEIGFAVGRGTKIISFKMGEDPTGFISKQQALPRLKKTAEEVAKEIDGLLEEDLRTADRLRAAKASLAVSLDDEIPF